MGRILRRKQLKVQRIDIMINTKENNHKKYLYNEVQEFTNKNKLGGEFRNNYIKLNSVPESLLTILEEAKIIYKKIKH